MSSGRNNPVTFPDSDKLDQLHGYKEDLLLESDHESGSPPDTPKSYTSSESSSLISTPRYNLLWDHGYDVDEASAHCKSPQERALEWRKFNKTDDDKLQADLHEQALGSTPSMIQHDNEDAETVHIDTRQDVVASSPRLSNDLPDLISSMSSSFGNAFPGLIDHQRMDSRRDGDDCVGTAINTNAVDVAEETVVVEKGQIKCGVDNSEDDIPPPLPDSTPPTLGDSESPPPLPSSSPPDLEYVINVNDNDSSQETTDDEVKYVELESYDTHLLSNDNNNDMDCEKHDNGEHDIDDLYKKPVKVNDFADLLYAISENGNCANKENEKGDNELQNVSGNAELSTDIEEINDINHSENDNFDMQEQVRQFKALLNLTETEGESVNKSKEKGNTDLEEHSHSRETDIVETEECTNSKPAETEHISDIQEQINMFKDLLDKQMFDKEVEEEFEAIINALDINYMDETYVERFANRRDRYGFILSPVVEAPTPSPTPSSMSGYSGLSSVSPDPLSMFRMSPRPSSRTDLDLSSLGIVPEDWDISPDSTVPIYQTFKATRAVVIPDGYGWDSSDDLLSGSGEWEIGDGELKSPPISTSSVTLSHFGSHVVGWKHPDSVIMEEPETTSGNDCDSDTDDTINGENDDSDNDKSTHDSNRPSEQESVEFSDNTVSADEDENDLEAVLEKMNDLIEDKQSNESNLIEEGLNAVIEEHKEERNVLECITFDEETNESVQNGNTNTHVAINDNVTLQISKTDEELVNIAEKAQGAPALYTRTDSNISNQTSEHRSSPEDNEDAGDEMSDTGDTDATNTADSDDSDTDMFDQKGESLKRSLEPVEDQYNIVDNGENVHITDMMSPRTAILLAGGMFPKNDDDSSSFTTDSDSETDDTKSIEITSEQGTPKPQQNVNTELQRFEQEVQVTQYTSDDSDVSGRSSIVSETPVRQNANNIKVSFRGKYNLCKSNDSPSSPQNEKETKLDMMDRDNISASSTPTVSIVSPMDFSIFGDKLDRTHTHEGGRSPRVLGRHYSELDEDVLAKSLSPPVIDMRVEDIFSSTTVDKISVLHHGDVEDDYEHSFKNVDFSLPKSVTTKTDESNAEEKEGNISDVSSNSSESSIEDNELQRIETEKVLHNMKAESTEANDIAITERNWEQPINTRAHVTKQNKRKTPPITKALNRKQRRSPVHIQVSHLKRKGSTRNKIKKGFVQQLSEIFAKKQTESKQEPEIQVTKRRPRESDYARVNLPEQLTAKENVIISSSSFRKSERIEVEDANGGSLGFDLSSDHRHSDIDDENQEQHDEDTDSNSELEFQDDVSSLHTVNEIDDDVKMYEDSLRKLDDDNEDNEIYTPTTHIESDTNIGQCDEGASTVVETTHARQVEQTVLPHDTNIKSDEERCLERNEHTEQEILQPLLENNINMIKTEDNTGDFKRSFSSEPPTFPDDEDNSVDIDVDDNEYYNNMKLFRKWISKSVENITQDDPISSGESFLRYVSQPNLLHCQDEDDIQVQHSQSDDEGQNYVNDQNSRTYGENRTEDPRKYASTYSPQTPFRQPKDGKTNGKREGGIPNSYASDLLNRRHLFDVSIQNQQSDDLGRTTSQENITNHSNIDEHAGSVDTQTGPSRKRSFLKDKMELLSKLDLPEDTEKVIYPPSLSRRLYGPFLRQRERSPQPLSDTILDSECQETLYKTKQREVTRPTLSHQRTVSPFTDCDTCQITDAESTINVSEKRNLTTHHPQYEVKDRDRGASVRMRYPGTQTRDIDCNDENTDAWINYELSQLDLDNPVPFCEVNGEDIGLNADIFQHTLYEVKTPVSHSPSIRDDVPSNVKPITVPKSNETERLYQRENKFANANIRSSECPQAVNIDASCDKLRADFSESECLSEVRRDVLPVILCGDNSCSTSDKERLRGVFTRSRDENLDGQLTNGIFQQKMGVFPTTENSVDVDTLSSITMKENGPLKQARSVEGKASSLGINDSTSAETVTVNQAYMSTGEDLSRDSQGGESERARNVPAAWTTKDKHVSVVVLPPDCQHVLEDEKGNLKVWPYSDLKNSAKLPVTLHTARRRVKGRPNLGMIDTNTTSNMTVIQSAQHSTEMPENKMVKKYHSSSVMPADNSEKNLMHTHSDSVQKVLLQDSNGNMVSEEELSKILPKIADLVARMETSEAEEILPGISQSVTKLRNGGNLVITTMTRKVDEVDSDSSSGRGSPGPTHPVLDVDDLEDSKIYLVQDSNGEMFYVEDITSESQESAYFSSSRNTSESVSDGANSPSFKRISKINQVGDSGIQNSTAEEILSAMYNDGTVHEMNENEEEWSERTYEYDIPKRRPVEQTNGYSKDSYNTSYVVEEPDTMPRTKTTTKDKFESFYEMSENQPWVADGGQMQSYSEATQVVGVDKTDAASTVDHVDNYPYRMTSNVRQTSAADRSGYTNTQESYTVDAEAQIYPMVPYQYPAPVPLPMFMPPPPVCIPEVEPQYSLVKVKITPPQSEESVTSSVDVTQHNKTIEIDERPIYKTVAHIQTGEKPPPVKSDMQMAKKTYKLISSKASPVKEEEQESHMSFGEVDYRCTTENVEVKQAPKLQTKQFFVRDSTRLEQQQQHRAENEKRFRSEKKLELSTRGLNTSTSNNTTTIDVRPAVTNHYGNDIQTETYEERNYSYDQVKASVEPANDNMGDMRVIRGSYLIKNNLEEVDGEFDDNINMFDGNFVLSKENPLYQSDEDLYRKLDRERAEHAQRQDRFQRDYRQDLTYETVDKFSKSKTVKREEPKPKQSITEMLLSKLSTIDSKDIHQKIDVKHHSEDIYGDPRFLQADGISVTSQSTNDFDTVGEKVDLLLKEGKAFITVKVTAERITPVDMEFNVWRKNQAIVTRIIEVDLLATEQRRRLYYKVMEDQTKDPRTAGRRDWRAGPNETILDGHQTLELFSKILGAADGEGDKEDVTVKTRQTNTTRPFSSGMDLLY